MPLYRRDYYDSKGRRKGWSTSYRPLSQRESKAQSKADGKAIALIFVALVAIAIGSIVYGAILSAINWVCAYATHPFPGNIFAWNIYIVTAGPWRIGAALYEHICGDPITGFHNLNIVIFVVLISILISGTLALLVWLSNASETPRKFLLKATALVFAPAIFSLVVWTIFAIVAFFNWMLIKS